MQFIQLDCLLPCDRLGFIPDVLSATLSGVFFSISLAISRKAFSILILFRFSDDSFNASFISTIGIDFKIKTIELDGRKIKLQIWDTAGQERFHTITTSYYRGATGIMLVYDVTQARSFENINKWLRNIDDHASDDVVKMLIGNKCDMDDKRCITRARGDALAREHAIPFLETSAKNNVNVEKAFFEMARLILKKTPEIATERTSGINPNLSQGNRQSNCINCM